MVYLKKIGSLLLLVLCVTGCSSLPKRLITGDNIAASRGMTKVLTETDDFILTSYRKVTDPTKPLNIYIEGDGFAWVSRSKLSSNPTPHDPLALRLAAADYSANVVYIARPCQYTSFDRNPLCSPRFWSASRFSALVIDSMNQAVDHILKETGTKQINLVGYSGGAAVAAIIAAKRKDIISLRTVAGNLDHAAVNEYHKVSPLTDSLNPIDFADKLSALPQYHFVGAKDDVIPVFIAKKFAEYVENGRKCVKVSTVKGATHHSGWYENWEYLLNQPVSCGGKG